MNRVPQKGLQCLNPETPSDLDRFREAFESYVDAREDRRERELETYLGLGAATVAEFMNDEPAQVAVALSHVVRVYSDARLNVAREILWSPTDGILKDRIALCQRHRLLPPLHYVDPIKGAGVRNFMEGLLKSSTGVRLFCEIVMMLAAAQDDESLAPMLARIVD
jgi:hypothetical protein